METPHKIHKFRKDGGNLENYTKGYRKNRVNSSKIDESYDEEKCIFLIIYLS